MDLRFAKIAILGCSGKHNQTQNFRTSKMRNDSIGKKSELLSIAGQFSEFDEFMEVTAAWDIDFRQIGRGRLNATLAQAVGESWSLAKARFDRPAYQQGVSVPGMRTFAILDPSAPAADWCGRPFTSDTLVVFAKNGEFRSISPPGFDVYTLSFTDEQLAAACERLGIPDVANRLATSDSTLQLDRGLSGVLRYLVNVALKALCFSGRQDSAWAVSDHFRDEISEHLVLLLAGGSPLVRTPSQRGRTLAVNCALEVIEAGLEDGVSVREVAEAANMSRRTLEYAFRDRFGISPKAFINAQRLIRVRRDLRARSAEVPITDIANRWGFWHMGQFACDFQRQFGELPSESTLRDRCYAGPSNPGVSRIVK
jgi:AraC family ethanolamine operon transcriptional activator